MNVKQLREQLEHAEDDDEVIIGVEYLGVPTQFRVADTWLALMITRTDEIYDYDNPRHRNVALEDTVGVVVIAEKDWEGSNDSSRID